MYYFVSDIHLGLQGKEYNKLFEDRFIVWLNSIENNCHTLFLLGDIFDF